MHKITLSLLLHGYTLVLGIVSVPIFMSQLGEIAYGWYATYGLMLALFQLIDIGFAGSITRTFAKTHEKTISKYCWEYFTFVRSILILISVVVLSGVFIYSLEIAIFWFDYRYDPLEAQFLIKVMALCCSIAILVAIYKAVLLGMSNIALYSIFGIVFGTIRNLIVVIYCGYMNLEIKDFFLLQTIVSVVELIFLEITLRIIYGGIKFPTLKFSLRYKNFIKEIRLVFEIAGSSIIWGLCTQLDKIVVSKIAGIMEYAYYSVAVSGAMSVVMVSSAFGNVLIPLLTREHSINGSLLTNDIFKTYAKYAFHILIPIWIILALFSYDVLFAWTGKSDLAAFTATPMALLTTGNVILFLTSLFYYAQLAVGDLRFHSIGNFIFLLSYIPTLYLLSTSFGIFGASLSWLVINLIYLIFWVRFANSKIKIISYNAIISKSLISVIFLYLAIGLLAKFLLFDSSTRLYAVYNLFIVCCMLSVIFIIANRHSINNTIKRWV